MNERYFYWQDVGIGDVIEWFRDSDPDTGEDRWVQSARFLQLTGDGGWTAFPSLYLNETMKDPDLTAYRHLQRWEKLRVDWGKEHPSEDLPDWIISTGRPTSHRGEQ